MNDKKNKEKKSNDVTKSHLGLLLYCYSVTNIKYYYLHFQKKMCIEKYFHFQIKKKKNKTWVNKNSNVKILSISFFSKKKNLKTKT